MTGVRALLLDLDGTLLDSAPDLIGALNWLRAAEGLPPLQTESMSQFISHGAAAILRAGMPAADEACFDSWKQQFLRYYAENSVRLSRLYEGIPELLDWLDHSSIPWGIVTNKSEALTQPILRTLDISRRVACVVCGDTLNRSKPDPAPVNLACRLLETPNHETLFAGDDLRDLQAGSAAGTPTAAVLYGYGLLEPSDALVAESKLIHHPADLIRLFSS